MPIVYALPQKNINAKNSERARSTSNYFVDASAKKTLTDNYFSFSKTMTYMSAKALHVSGNRIVDTSGNTVTLRGFNVIGHYHDSNSGEWNIWDYYDTNVVDRFFAKAKSYGVNIIRECSNAESWVKNPIVNSNIPNLRVRDMYKDFINRAREHGIYIILNDMSVTATDPDIDFAYPLFTANEKTLFPTRQSFIDYVVQRTVELGEYDNYIADFWNEPYWMSASAVVDYQSIWQQAINNVRAQGYDGLIVTCYGYSLATWGNPEDSFMNLNWYYDYPLYDPLNNMVIGFHLYRESISDKHTYSELKDLFTNVLHIKDIASEIPVICEETGAKNTDNDEDEFLANSLAIYNEWGLSYIGWCLCSKGTTSDMLQSGTTKDQFILNQHGQIVVNAIQSGK